MLQQLLPCVFPRPRSGDTRPAEGTQTQSSIRQVSLSEVERGSGDSWSLRRPPSHTHRSLRPRDVPDWGGPSPRPVSLATSRGSRAPAASGLGAEAPAQSEYADFIDVCAKYRAFLLQDLQRCVARELGLLGNLRGIPPQQAAWLLHEASGYIAAALKSPAHTERRLRLQMHLGAALCEAATMQVAFDRPTLAKTVVADSETRLGELKVAPSLSGSARTPGTDPLEVRWRMGDIWVRGQQRLRYRPRQGFLVSQRVLKLSLSRPRALGEPASPP